MSFSSLGSKHSVGDIYPVRFKKVLLVVDPQNITDNPTDYGATFSTVALLLQKGASVIIASSFGSLTGVTMNLSHKEREAALNAFEREAGMGYTNYFAILPPKIKIAVLRAVPNLTLSDELHELPKTGKTTLFASLNNDQKIAALTSCLGAVEFSASSTRPFVEILQSHFPDYTVKFARDCLRAPLFQLASQQILVLENLRFYRNEVCESAEERLAMAQVLAAGVDFYVNDSFATSHCYLASNVELPRVLQHGAAGCSMDRELAFYSKYLVHSARPMAVVVGGLDMIEKLKLIRSLVDKVDRILVAGAVALPFLVAQGIPCGRSYYEWYKESNEAELSASSSLLTTTTNTKGVVAEVKRNGESNNKSRKKSVHDSMCKEPTIRRPVNNPRHLHWQQTTTTKTTTTTSSSSQPASEFSSIILPSPPGQSAKEPQHALAATSLSNNINNNINNNNNANRRRTLCDYNTSTRSQANKSQAFAKSVNYNFSKGNRVEERKLLETSNSEGKCNKRDENDKLDELAQSLKRSINLEQNKINFDMSNDNNSTEDTCVVNEEAIMWNEGANELEYEEVPCSVYAREILDLCAVHQVELILPIDHIIVPDINTPVSQAMICGNTAIPHDSYVMDCGMHTINLFARCLRNCRTVYWTGTFGFTEKGFISGTNAFATLLGSLNVAAVVAGQDTARALQKLDVTHINLHVSSGKLACLEVLQGHPLPGVNALSDIVPKCMDAEVNSSTVNELLHHLPLFHGCTPHQMKLIAKKFTRHQHSRGDYLVYGGEHHTHLYLVAAGGLIAQHISDVGSGVARFIAPGQSVGMYEFISQATSTETVRVAQDNVITFQLSYSSFVELVHSYPDLAAQLVQNLSQPLRRMAAEDYAAQQTLKEIVQRNACQSRIPLSTVQCTRGSGLWHDCIYDMLDVLLLQRLTIQYKPYAETELCPLQPASEYHTITSSEPILEKSSLHLSSLSDSNNTNNNDTYNYYKRLLSWMPACWAALCHVIRSSATHANAKSHFALYQFTGLPFALMHSLLRNILYHRIVQQWQTPLVASAVANVITIPIRLASYGMTVKAIVMSDMSVLFDEILSSLCVSCAPLICFAASEMVERQLEKRTRSPLRNSMRLLISVLTRMLVGVIFFPVMRKRYLAHALCTASSDFWDWRQFQYYELKQALSVLIRWASYEVMRIANMV